MRREGDGSDGKMREDVRKMLVDDREMWTERLCLANIPARICPLVTASRLVLCYSLELGSTIRLVNARHGESGAPP